MKEERGDYELYFRAESSVDYFCEINRRKPHARPEFSQFLLNLNLLENKKGGKGIFFLNSKHNSFSFELKRHLVV